MQKVGRQRENGRSPGDHSVAQYCHCLIVPCLKLPHPSSIQPATVAPRPLHSLLECRTVAGRVGAVKVLIDACCLGRRKTGNETYIRGLLRGLADCGKAGDRSQGTEVRRQETGDRSGGQEAPRAVPELAVVTTAAHRGERPGCFEWMDIPLGNFATRNFLTLPRVLKSSGAALYHASYWTRFWAEPVPSVVMIHDLSFVSFPQGFRPHERLVYAGLIRQVARRARHLVTVSEFSKQELMERWKIPADRITVTYNGLDPCFRPKAGAEGVECRVPSVEGEIRREPGGLRDEHGPTHTPNDARSTTRDALAPSSTFQPYILYVGNLHPRKNLVRLLEAFVRLKAEARIPHQLKIVGQAAWLCGDIFETVRRHRLEGEVEFTGYVAQDELVRLYQDAALAVYPSLYEGFGLPVLEAMACGCPVVTSRTTSIPEVAGEAAELVDPESVDAIAAGLARVAGDAAWAAELRRRGPERAARFTWEATARQTLAAWERALG